MKLDTVLGAFLLSATVLACSAKSEEAPATEQPAAATTPAAPATDAPKVETAPKTETGATTDAEPATPAAPVALTCETAKTVAPAGKLVVTKALGIKPIDVFATETDRGLTITLTETANECGYRAAKIAHEQMNELSISVRKKGNGPIAAGELAPEGIATEQGQACQPPREPDDFDFGGIGTAMSGSSATGKITITTKTATLVEGTVDVKDWQGNKTTFTFTAPICPSAADDAKGPAQDVTCCAGAAPKEDE